MKSRSYGSCERRIGSPSPRWRGVCEQSIDGWSKRYDEFKVDEVLRLKKLEAENLRLRNRQSAVEQTSSEGAPKKQKSMPNYNKTAFFYLLAFLLVSKKHTCRKPAEIKALRADVNPTASAKPLLYRTKTRYLTKKRVFLRLPSSHSHRSLMESAS